MLATTADVLLTRVGQAGDAAAFLRSLLAEIAVAPAVLVLRGVDRLLDDVGGRVLLDGLLDAVRDGRLGCLLAVTGSPGFDRNRAEAPRLLGFVAVLMLDARPPHSFDLRSIVVPGARDLAERGWLVAVRCRLTGPALAALLPGGERAPTGTFDGGLVDRMWLVESDRGPAALMVSVAPGVAGAGDRGLAAEVAVAARRGRQTARPGRGPHRGPPDPLQLTGHRPVRAEAAVPRVR